MKGTAREPIFNLPNFFSLSRIVLVPFFIYAMLKGQLKWAFVLFLVSAVTDFLDGASARLLNQKTKLGALLDPLGDKLFMTAAMIMLSIPALNSPHVLPLWLIVLVIGRDILIVTGALVLYLKVRRKDFSPVLSGKASTVCLFFVLLLVLFFNLLHQESRHLIWGYILTSLLTIVSGTEYMLRGCRWYYSDRNPPGSSQ